MATKSTPTTDSNTADLSVNVKPEGQVFDPAERARIEREYERGADMPSYAEPNVPEEAEPVKPKAKAKKK